MAPAQRCVALWNGDAENKEDVPELGDLKAVQGQAGANANATINGSGTITLG